jgi:hypothetical protein
VVYATTVLDVVHTAAAINAWPGTAGGRPAMGAESNLAATATSTGRPAPPACYAGSGTSTGLSPGNPPSLSSSCMTLLHFRSQVDNLRGYPSGLLIGPVRFVR